MPIGETSLTAWILLWLAALSSVATFLLSLRRDAQARRKARIDEERLWSLTWADYLDDGPFRCLKLRLHDVDKHKCRLKTITISKPGAGRLAPQTWIGENASEPWHKRSQADRTAIGRRISVARDLDGTNVRFSGQQYEDVYFYILMPKRPALGFAARTPVHVVCRISEISRRSRRRKITLISPPTDWAPPDSPKAEDLKQKA